MSRATTIALANTLMDSLGDTTQLGSYYDDVVLELGRGVLPGVVALVGAGFVAGVADTGTYTWPTTAIRVLAVAYDTRQLAEAMAGEADLFDREWRSTRGVPIAYVTADENQRVSRLVPVPAVSGVALGVDTPFTWTAWPGENVTFIYTEQRTDVHLDEELAVALEIMAREYSRDSNHHDPVAAAIAKQLSTLFFRSIYR